MFTTSFAFRGVCCVKEKEKKGEFFFPWALDDPATPVDSINSRPVM
jgi:hypothetical protein